MNETEAISWITGHVGDLNRTDYIFHPAIMDAVFSMLFCSFHHCTPLTITPRSQSSMSWNLVWLV